MADLEWYRSFVAVYRAGTVSGAARTRFLTQPAVSQQLAALESALGQAQFQLMEAQEADGEKATEEDLKAALMQDVMELAARKARVERALGGRLGEDGLAALSGRP